MHGRCRENVKATIDTPNLLVFGYKGFVMPNDVISLKAQNPLFANILLNWDDEEVAEPTFLPPWTHLRILHFQNISGRPCHHRYVMSSILSFGLYVFVVRKQWPEFLT